MTCIAKGGKYREMPALSVLTEVVVPVAGALYVHGVEDRYHLFAFGYRTH